MDAIFTVFPSSIYGDVSVNPELVRFFYPVTPEETVIVFTHDHSISVNMTFAKVQLMLGESD